MDTGEKQLVEPRHDDPIWACGFTVKDVPFYKAYWKPNLMGKAVMEARARLLRNIDLAYPSRP